MNAQQEPVLPNDHAWRPDLVLTLLVSRLLSQADSALDMPVRTTLWSINWSVLSGQSHLWVEGWMFRIRGVR